MARTATLRYGRAVDLAPCLVCAKMEWLSERLRVFSSHIDRKEKELYATWNRAHPIRLGELENAQAHQKRWERAMPRVAERLRGNPNAAKALKAKTAQLKQNTQGYQSRIKATRGKYIEEHIPFPIHVKWHRKLSGVVARWGREHPSCQGIEWNEMPCDNLSPRYCRILFGGFHWATPNEDRLCPLCATERARGGPVQISGGE